MSRTPGHRAEVPGSSARGRAGAESGPATGTARHRHADPTGPDPSRPERALGRCRDGKTGPHFRPAERGAVEPHAPADSLSHSTHDVEAQSGASPPAGPPDRGAVLRRFPPRAARPGRGHHQVHFLLRSGHHLPRPVRDRTTVECQGVEAECGRRCTHPARVVRRELPLGGDHLQRSPRRDVERGSHRPQCLRALGVDPHSEVSGAECARRRSDDGSYRPAGPPAGRPPGTRA